MTGGSSGQGEGSKPSPLDAVITRMEAIAAAHPASDGVARFNHLYLAVTREVASQLEGAEYGAPEFVARLDVLFAELYFAAVEAAERGVEPSRAWAPLFEARSRSGIAPIQFALAGMNAHINFDLCVALEATCRELGVKLARGSAEHRDYVRVNETLERVQERVKRDFLSELGRLADKALGRVDDVVAIWKIARAREAAWTHAEALGLLRRSRLLSEQYLDVLGGMVGLAGRGLLVRTL